MFEKYTLVVPKNEESIDRIMLLAANRNLDCRQKIGVYGSIRQDEIYISGKISGKLKFLKEIREKELVQET